MASRDDYRSQVELLIRCLPSIAAAPDFALKGGTAINLFLTEMPRLSVDIDLTYLPLSDRVTAVQGIRSGLIAVSDSIETSIPGVNIQTTRAEVPKLLVTLGDARIKIEPNGVWRGSYFPADSLELCDRAQEQFEQFVLVNCLSAPDVWGGKICAALDRQHPRDLFDVMQLQAAGPIPDAVREAFVVYVAGHSRPIADLLKPRIKPIDDVFANQFLGMTEESVDLEDLEQARLKLFAWTKESLIESERRFLLSVKQGQPDWNLLPCSHVEKLPAIQWKVRNVRRMEPHAHKLALERLRIALNL